MKTKDYDKLKKQYNQLIELHSHQLAAITRATLHNTAESIKKFRLSSDSKYYTATYNHVCAAIDREVHFREENKKLKKLLSQFVESKNINNMISLLEI